MAKVKDIEEMRFEPDELVNIIAGDKHQAEAGDTINAGINGTFYYIKCGEETMVPKSVAKLLEEGGYAVKQAISY